VSFPTVVQFSGGSPAANTSSYVITFPGGAPTAGQLLIVLLGLDDNPTVNALTGWTELVDGPGASSACHIMVAYRVSDGTEGTTDTFTISANQGGGWQCYVISGYDTGEVPEITSIATGTSAAANSGSLAPSWGSADTLWITAFAQDGFGAAPSPPTNYGNNRRDGWNNAEGASIASARRTLAASSEDPGAWTNQNDQWGAVTIAVKGISAAPRSQAVFVG
jgi:hypothetical protein